MLHCYARVLARYPYLIVAAVLVITITCLGVSIFKSEGFHFERPRAGFETRGTELSEKLVAYNNLLRISENSLSLTPFPYQHKTKFHHKIRHRNKNRHRKKRRKNRKRKKKKNKRKKQRRLRNTLGVKKVALGSRHANRLRKTAAENYFCDDLDEKYARVVFKSLDGSSLFTLKNIQAMCRLESKVVRSTSLFTELCIDDSRECRSWSLGNYIGLLSNKTSCTDLEENDIALALQTLSHCGQFYRNYSLGAYCEECIKVPAVCKLHNAVYHILHYLTDAHFTTITPQDQPVLAYSISFLPFVQSSATVNLFEYIEGQDLQEENVELVAANFGIKDVLFKQYIWLDSKWLFLTAASIFLAIWLYSASFFITLMTFLAIFWSLEIAYFLYVFVLGISFFPYMNMVTVMIMVGIGADDTFIYCKVWNLAKTERSNVTLEKIVAETLKHAATSMLVSSLTTAAAFLANVISDITAIRCFSIYVGTSVLCNFLLMMTWMPAMIVIYEKSCNCLPCCSSDEQGPGSVLCRVPRNIHKSISNCSRIFFEKILPCLVIKFRYFWLVVFGILGLASIAIVFVYPGIKLPTKEKFQYFSSSHLLEVYDLHLWNHFWFEKTEIDQVPLMPITVVWGVLAEDTGDLLNPSDHGTLRFDNSFHMETTKAQAWLMDFCSRFRQQPFYQHVPGYEIANCFLENYRNYMAAPCVDDYQKTQGCCNVSSFPYSPETFTRCLGLYIPDLMNTPYIGSYYSNYQLPGPRFKDGQIRAFLVEFSSAVPFTNAYEKLRSFYSQVNMWIRDQLSQAPEEIRGGWFVSYLQFFDLQNSILHGLPLALGLSVAVAATVIFFTTLNFFLSLYAVVTVAFTILTTVAALLLLGWELNILESVVITVAIGMSIDFTLHYGVAYRLSSDLDTELRVVCSISRMGSAIAMASLTTFFAGALMLPATVLVYRQFGLFLMILITTSWLYATFFFQSLLRVLGPSGTFGQFYWPSWSCCANSTRSKDKGGQSVSESTLSSSTVSNQLRSGFENHELERLTKWSAQVPPYSGHSNHARQPIVPKQSSKKAAYYKEPCSKCASQSHKKSMSTRDNQLKNHFLLVKQENNSIPANNCSSGEESEVWIRRVDT